jgi:hypothetical protein
VFSARSIHRFSGLIVTDNLNVGPEGQRWASCAGVGPGPTHGTYNVLVRGDSTSSTVKATARWSFSFPQASDTECPTTHAWEREIEDQIKQRAEGPSFAGRAGSLDGETDANRKAREEEAARARARLPRSNAELLLEPNFGLAVADCTRLGLIGAYGETARDTLVVDLTDEAMASSGLEYQLSRLFKGYLDTTGRSRATILELRHSGRGVGEYTWNGLARTDWR